MMPFCRMVKFNIDSAVYKIKSEEDTKMTAELVQIELGNYLEERARKCAREQRRREAFLKRRRTVIRQRIALSVMLFAGVIGIIISLVSLMIPDSEAPVIEEVPRADLFLSSLASDWGVLSEPQYAQQIVTSHQAASIGDVVYAKPAYIYDISDEDRLFFEQIMAAESYSYWRTDDVLSLCTVVVNRVNSKDFPNTFRGVLEQGKQFETYANGRYLTVEIADEVREAVDLALRGEVNLNSEVMWFCTKKYYEDSSKDDFFRTLDHVYTCRNVYFFTE